MFVCLFTLPHCYLPLKEVGTGTLKQGRTLDAGAYAELHGGVLLTGLLHMAYSACFLIEPRTNRPGMAPLTMVWALPHQKMQPGLFN